MEERWLMKEKKTWFKIIKKGIVLHCAALMIGGGLMIASPAMADFTISGPAVSPQVLDENGESGEITNSGVLAVTDQTHAVRLDSKYGLSLTNDGTITATASGDAVAVSMGSVEYSSVSNTGTIDVDVTSPFADATGIRFVGLDTNSDITSTGTIEVTAAGEDSDAYGIRGEDNDGAISSSTMTVAAGEDAVGIAVIDNDEDATITNAGPMSITSAGEDAVGIDTYNNDGSILNDGAMTVTSSGEDAVGIEAYYNNGTIVNDAAMTVTSTGEDAVGVEVEYNNGSIVNSDTITVTGEYSADGIYVDDNEGTISNSGTITVSANYYAAGIVVDDENYGLVENSGTITVDTARGRAAGIIIDDNYATVTNIGTVTVTSAGEDAVGIDVYANEGEDSVVENIGILTVTNTGEDATGIDVGDNDGSISNSGTITVTAGEDAVGIDLSDNYDTVSNSGTITVTAGEDAVGIDLSDNYGTVSNSNTITVTAGEDAVGIYVDDNDGTIVNSGTMTITSTDGDAYGIYVEDDNTGTVMNSGTIIASTTNGDADGIDVYYNGEDGLVENRGAITATSTYGDGTGIDVDYNYATVMNSGTIVAESGEDGDAYGIDVEYNYSGTVANEGTITVAAVDGYAIGINADLNGEDAVVVNSGPLTVSSETNGAYGIYVGTNFGAIENAEGNTITVTGGKNVVGIQSINSIDDEITNSGTINVTRTDGDYDEYGNFAAGILKGGLLYSSGDRGGYASGVINNTGSVTVVAGAGALTVGVGAIGESFGEDLETSTINNAGIVRVEGGENYIGVGILNINYSGDTEGVVNNSGTVVAVGSDGELHGEDYSVYAPTSVVNNTETGSLTGNLLAGELNNDGMIRLPTAQGRVFGDFEQSAAGVLGITLFSDDNVEADYNIEYSQLRVDGDVVFADGTTVDVDVKTALDHQSLLINQTLEGVVVGEDAIGVDLEQLNVTDNSALLAFTPILSAEDSSLDLSVYKDVSVVEATLNSGEGDVVGAAGVFDDLLDEGAGGDPELDEFLDELVVLETEEEVADAVLQASPVVAGALPGLNTQLFKTFNAIIHARQRSVRGFNSGDVAFSDNNLWAKTFGSYAEQEDDGATRGFIARSYGIGLGADGEYAPNKRAGVAFFYSNSDVDTNDIRQEADVDSFNLLAYGSNQIVDETVELFYQLGFGLQQMDTSRYVDALSSDADADYTAKSIYAELKGVKTLEMNDNFRTLLALALSYTYFDSPTYSEKGLGGMSLKVDSFDADSLTVEAEADFIYSLTENLELLANVGIGYDVIDDDVTIHSSFQGASNQTFVTDGVDSNPFVYQAGLGVAQNLRDDLSVDLNYDLEGRGSDFSSHTVSAKLNWKF